MKEMLSPRGMSKVLKVPVRTVYRLIRAKKIKSIRVGRLIRVCEADFESYIKSELDGEQK